MPPKRKIRRRRSSRYLLVAIPSHRANTDLVALFRNLANSLAKKIKQPHVASKSVVATVCPLCGITPPPGKHLQVIHKLGHEQIDVVQQAIIKKRKPATFEGAPAYVIRLAHLKDFYRNYHQTQACVAIGCGDCHKKYDDVCKGTIAKGSVVAWWKKLNRCWTTV